MTTLGVVAVAVVSTLSLPEGDCTPQPALRLPRPARRGFQSQPCATRALSPSPAAWVVAKELVVRAAASTWRGNVLCLGNSGTGRQEVMARDAG